MTRPEALVFALFVGSLFALALFCNPPRRGRHHVRPSLLMRPFDDRPRPSPDQIAARLRREAESRAALGFVKLTIVPDVEGIRRDVRFALESLGGNGEGVTA
jgi:hypothetical protein